MDHHATSNQHSSMDHSDHSPMCNMNMLFTWDTDNMCVVFKWWHIRSYQGLVLSLAIIVLLGTGYEYLRALSRRMQKSVEQNSEENPLNPTNNNVDRSGQPKYSRTTESAVYAFQVGYSFMLMLIFMTYNGWAMLAVVAGAFLGHYLWGERSTRDMACH